MNKHRVSLVLNCNYNKCNLFFAPYDTVRFWVEIQTATPKEADKLICEEKKNNKILYRTQTYNVH